MDLSNIRLEYSPWFIILCLVLGLLYAVFLYRNSRLKEYNPAWRVIALAIVRALVVSILAFLLLGPVVRYFDSRTQEPIVVLVVDQSSSMVASAVADSSEVVEAIGKVAGQLNRNFKLDTIGFGSTATSGTYFNFDKPSTDIDEAITYIKSRYEGIPLVGVVLATDGIYNQGRNPIYAIQGMRAPIYPIPFGDTTTQSDVKIEQVLHNKVAYLGDKFPIEVDISADKSTNTNFPVQLYIINNGNRKKIASKSVEVKKSPFFKTLSFQASANEVGVMHLQLVIPTLSGEMTMENNYKDIFIDVIDSRQKILLMGESPHPDMGAIYQSLTSFDNYEVDRFIYPDKPTTLRDYDLVILHQLPSVDAKASSLLEKIGNEDIPVFWIVGEQTNLNLFNKSQEVVNIQQRGNQTDKVQAVFNPSFNYYELDEQIIKDIPLYPPFDVPFGQYKTGKKTQVLLHQKVGNIETDKPLILLQDYDNVKSAVFTGEGIWRWRLFDYLEHNSHARMDNFISQIVKFLSTQKDLRRFRVEVESRLVDENEEVQFTADLYNATYQSVVGPEVSITISSGEKQYDYTFSPTEQNYRLNAGYFEPGTYQWTALSTFDGSQYTESGKFIVKPIQREMLQLEADHGLLAYLAENTGGKMWDIAKLNSHIEALKRSPYAKEVQYTSERNRPMIALSWIGGVLAFLLLLEWFLRRMMGDY